MNARSLVLALATLLAPGCFSPAEAPPAATATPAQQNDNDEDECLEELDAMCACAEAAGSPCTDTDRNLYEEVCNDAALRSDVTDCIDDALVCEDAVAACMP